RQLACRATAAPGKRAQAGRRAAARKPREPTAAARSRCARGQRAREYCRRRNPPRAWDDPAMTELDRAIVAEPAPWRPAHSGVSVGFVDVLAALLTFGSSLAVLAYGMSAIAQFAIFLGLHLAVLAIPAMLWALRARRNGELTFPVLLTLATLVSGPIGA